MEEQNINVDANAEMDEAAETTVDTAEVEAEDNEGNNEADANAEIEIPFKFLGEEGKMKLSEAQQYLEKGKNYDHIKEERDRLRKVLEEKEKAELEAKAKSELEAYINSLVEKDGMDEETAKKIARAEAIEKADNERRTIQTKFNEFITKNPEVADFDKWSPAMKEAYEKNGDYEKIYYKETAAKHKAELEAIKKAEENKAKSTGSVNTEQSKDQDTALENKIYELMKG